MSAQVLTSSSVYMYPSGFALGRTLSTARACVSRPSLAHAAMSAPAASRSDGTGASPPATGVTNARSDPAIAKWASVAPRTETRTRRPVSHW